MKKLLVIGLICVLPVETLNSEPLPVKNNTSSKLRIGVVGKHLLLRFCKKRNRNLVKYLHRYQDGFDSLDAVSSSLLLLAEFATGTGPQHRVYTPEHRYNRAYRHSEAYAYIRNAAVQWLDSSKAAPGEILHIRYQFSPDMQHPSLQQWRFSFREHRKVFRKKDLPQLVLGSVDAYVVRTEADRYFIVIQNCTSRKSFYLRIGKKVPRPALLGNIYQTLWMEESL